MSSLVRNTLYLTVASVVQKAIAFLYFTAVANRITTVEQGEYFLALSVVAILSVISDWGLTSVLIREIANKPADAVTLTRSTLGLKIPLILLASIGAIGLAHGLGYDALIIHLVTLATLILAADAVSLTCFGALRGLQNLRYESLGIFIGQLITSVVGLIALSLYPSLDLLVMALFIGSFWNAIYAASRVVKHLGWKAILPAFDTTRAKDLLRLSLAFALASIFVKVYSYMDSLLLKHFLGSEAVGIYSVAYKITYAFQFLPMAFVGGLYPALSARFANNDREELTRTFDNAIWYTGLMAVPVTFGIASTAHLIIGNFYPKYAEAALPLSIEVFALLPIFLDFPVGSLLNAARKQSIKTSIMGAVMILNIVLNILLIPRLGILGAAITAVVCFTVMFVAGMVFVPRLIPYTWGMLFRRLAPMVFSGFIMTAVVFAVRAHVPLLMTVGLGAGAYFMSLLLTGGLDKEHLRYLKVFRKGGTPTPTL